MKKQPVLWFYVLAFAISWLGWLPLVAGSRGVVLFKAPAFQVLLLLPAFGPALAAILVTRARDGKAGVRRLLRLLLQWRVGLLWLGIAILLPALVLLVTSLLTRGLSLTAIPTAQGNPGLLFTGSLVISLLSNPWEEVGWRGFALPHLQKRTNALLASLIVGVLWGLWHLPLFFWTGTAMTHYAFFPWFIGIVASAFVYTWLYNSTKGSLLIATLYHVLGNTYPALITGISISGLAIVYCVVALLLVIIFGKDNLSRQARIRAD